MSKEKILLGWVGESQAIESKGQMEEGSKRQNANTTWCIVTLVTVLQKPSWLLRYMGHFCIYGKIAWSYWFFEESVRKRKGKGFICGP